jgi:hypothetical protein
MLRRLSFWLAALLCLTQVASAQQSAKPFKKEELQQLLAPVALYPDQLLAQVLMASTYPLQVVQAARWQKDNSKVKGDALDKALAGKDWDPSVKSLIPFPQVLQMMNDRLEWTQKLGDAFLAQQADVMGQVQYLRQKAQQAGTLKSNKQQTISTNDNIIVIAPTSPQVVYVPVYNTTVVYGTWWYPAYPPYYYPPPTGAAFAAGVFWGAAITASAHYWGWGNCDWHRGDVNIDVNRYNQINVNRTQINSSRWQHNTANRGPVPYRDQNTRERYGQTNRRDQVSRDMRGFDGNAPRTRDIKPAASNNSNLKTNGPAQRPADRKADFSPNVSSRDSAFDVGNGSRARAESSRGNNSLQSMEGHRRSGSFEGRRDGGARMGGGEGRRGSRR